MMHVSKLRADAVGRPGERMPPLFDQRLLAALAIAAACCECSSQPERDVVFRGSVAWMCELAPDGFGDNAIQVRIRIVPVYVIVM